MSDLPYDPDRCPQNYALFTAEARAEAAERKLAAVRRAVEALAHEWRFYEAGDISRALRAALAVHCTDEFCEHDHAALHADLRVALDPPEPTP